ncbi:dihydrodipicolinate reductase [uncultured Roseobacter sp.]|uniref:dihydrodipicolinate reductase n=1 Tax=uncultured Roseobacter sp. TaxID=114847 RepID=UPI0026315DDD|nr:dihydrodipicolinate reductase [uncultured Roseobacter sp.]
MRAFFVSLLTAAAFSGAPAFAEFAKIDDQSEFMKLVTGKELKRPFVNLEVTADGQISGRGAAWPVTGNWTWKDGYFCRDLYWGGDALGYNCQEVKASDGRIRFTSDQGQGDSAEFRLR